MHYEILRLAKGGTGVSMNDGKIFFVENALPGETGDAEILEEKKHFGRARAISRETVSPYRVASDACRLHDCDGCGFRHVCAEQSLALKSEAVFADIARNAHLDPMAYETYGLTSSLDGQRRRVRLHLDGGELGFFARGSHRIIAAHACPVIAEPLRIAIQKLEKGAKLDDHLRAEIQIDLDDEDRPFAHLKSAQVRNTRYPSRPENDEKKCLETAMFLWKTGIFAGLRVGDRVMGIPQIRDTIRPQNRVPTVMYRRIGDFGQATAQANAYLHALVDESIAQCGAQSVADLYCGSGNLTFRAATVAPHVIGFEFYCDRNAFDIGVQANQGVFVPNAHVSLTQCDLTKGLPKEAALADFILCDPAREGLSERVAHDLAQCQARHLLYVSCEASCLARDLVRLSPHFKVQRLAFVDMFPQTPHVETVVLLRRF